MAVLKFKANLVVGVLLAALVCLTSGCAFTPQDVDIAPTLDLVESNVGNGVTVYVVVADERADSLIGHRGSAYGKAAKISNEQDISKIFCDAIVDGLKKYSFNPTVDDSEQTRGLNVQVRLIKYETSIGFWTGGIHTKAAVKVVASNNGEKYEKMYRVEDEKRILFVPGAKENTALINEIVSDVIVDIFVDEKLIAFLANSNSTEM